MLTYIDPKLIVSTHSRLKAAGKASSTIITDPTGFNTQPPEGGWPPSLFGVQIKILVSTHSRLKAAGIFAFASILSRRFQHTAA